MVKILFIILLGYVISREISFSKQKKKDIEFIEKATQIINQKK